MKGAGAPAPERPDYADSSGRIGFEDDRAFSDVARDIPRRNELVSAAESLLALISNVRSGRAQIDLPHLHATACAAVERYEDIVRGKFPDEHVKRAVYALSATVDDVAMNLPVEPDAIGEYALRSLTVTKFNEAVGGDRFWTLLEDMIAKPREYANVLELFHCCLASGFMGRLRGQASGKTEHQAMMQRVYLALSHPGSVSPYELSPHWRGVQAAAPSLRFWTPLVFAAAGACTILLLVYAGFRIALAHDGLPASTALESLLPDTPLKVARNDTTRHQVPHSTQLERIEKSLKEDIDQHNLEVEQTGSEIVIRSTVPALFDSASDQLSPDYWPMFDHIGSALEHEKGRITVTGHTDSVNNTSPPYFSNQRLSEARAESVALLIGEQLSDASRVTSRGVGKDGAIASNLTPEGQARNRRVEITIPRDDQ
jgi:type VI secretion system protein ImpK